MKSQIHQQLMVHINAAMAAKNMNRAELARKCKLPITALYTLSRKEPTLEKVEKICAALGITWQFISKNESPQFKVIENCGYVSANGSDPAQNGRAVFGAAARAGGGAVPPTLAYKQRSAHGGLVALTVQGDAMAPCYRNGDVLYVYTNDPLRAMPEQLIGKDCIVEIKGTTGKFLKRLRRADSNDAALFNLESINHAQPTAINQSITTALPIRWVTKAV